MNRLGEAYVSSFQARVNDGRDNSFLRRPQELLDRADIALRR
jgi:hypothetical protein